MIKATWAVFVAFFVSGATSKAEGPAIFQDPDKQAQQVRNTLAFHRRKMVEAYEKVGNKDPKWDAPAREALDLTARLTSRDGDQPVRVGQVYAAAKKALDAGCDDPMVLFVAARSMPKSNPEAQWTRFRAASLAVEKSAYPASRRAVASVFLANMLLNRKDATPEDRKEAERLVNVGLALFPTVATEEPRSRDLEQVWYEMSQVSTTTIRNLNGGDYEAAFNKVDEQMAKSPELKAARLLARGDFLMRFAWTARGAGLANTVNDDGWKKFSERLEGAGQALTEAWELQPDNARAASLMISIEKGLRGERASMEKWFDRAMKADPNNYEACLEKLEFLEPKWHGSYEELLEFGKACGETKNWRTGIDTLQAEAMIRRGRHLQDKEELKAYFRAPDVWPRFKEIYETRLKHFPDDNTTRTQYAIAAYFCHQHLEADRLFNILGTDVVQIRDYSPAWMTQIRKQVAEAAKEAKGAEVPSPP